MIHRTLKQQFREDWRWLVYPLLFAAVFVPLSVFAADLDISGANDATVNGCYVDTGMQAIGHVWELQSGGRFVITAGIVGTYTECRVTDNGNDTYPQAGSQIYYKTLGGSVACTSALAAGGTYIDGGGGAPVPTVAETTCIAPPVDVGGATSTVEQSQQNLSTAFVLLFVSFFGTVWLFRKQ